MGVPVRGVPVGVIVIVAVAHEIGSAQRQGRVVASSAGPEKPCPTIGKNVLLNPNEEKNSLLSRHIRQELAKSPATTSTEMPRLKPDDRRRLL
jgi:hypothetical protein